MEKPTRKATVVLLVDKDGRVCLAQKKQPIHHENGSIEYSLGTYNGYGGKSEWYDFGSIFLTAIRELWGEARIFAFPHKLKPACRIYFYVKDKKTGEFVPFMDVSFFLLRSWFGIPEEGKEMGVPTWFVQENIPYAQMMPADKMIFEKLFAGDRFVARVFLSGKGTVPDMEILEEPLS